MLDGPELERAIATIMKRLQGVNALYIRKIAAQIKRIGELTPSSVNRLVAMADMGADINEIREQLRLAVGASAKELRDIFQTALTETYSHRFLPPGTKGLYSSRNSVPRRSRASTGSKSR